MRTCATGFSKSILLLLFLLLLAMSFSLMIGGFSFYPSELMTGLSAQQLFILWEIRLPRILLAAVIGAGLAISGVALQSLFRNPLAEPGLIGVSSSAAFGAVFVIVLGGALWQEVAVWQISVAAFLMASLSTLLLYRIATRYGHTDVALMLLAGVAFNAVFGALTQLLIVFSDDTQLRSALFWMMGSLANLSWFSVGLVSGFVLMATMGLWRLVKPMNTFLLGESVSLQMGYDTKWFKWQVMGLSALIVGVSVSMVGVIGFVGLVVPHIIRLWVGADHRLVLPFSALGGAILLVLADLLARQILYPAELPIGLLMALLGGPFFLMMLISKRNGYSKALSSVQGKGF